MAISIRGMMLGEKLPKIIVPITGKTEEAILHAAQQIAAHPHADMAEWRADFYEHASDEEKTAVLVQKLRAVLQEKPLVYTLRTAREGGKIAVAPEKYAALCALAAQCGADLVDVEMFSPAADHCAQAIHAAPAFVLGSWHNFSQTPGEKELLDRFHAMQERGADVLKIAVMPQTLADVEHLIHAAQKMHSTSSRPLCAISMGDTGRITRTHCGHFGGCMTFGTLGASSAPGQISVDALHAALTDNISPL